jgi:hypothetical protein
VSDSSDSAFVPSAPIDGTSALPTAARDAIAAAEARVDEASVPVQEQAFDEALSWKTFGNS